MAEAPIVYVVDDDASVRASIGFTMRSVGRRAICFESGQGLLELATALPPAVVLLDVGQDGSEGVSVQRELWRRGIDFPVVAMVGNSDTQTAVNAINAGVSDFLLKPFSAQDLIATVIEAERRFRSPERQHARAQEARAMLERLTAPERRVLAAVTSGMPNADIADELGISIRTVEVHRAMIVRKFEVQSFTSVLRIALGGRVTPCPTAPRPPLHDAVAAGR